MPWIDRHGSTHVVPENCHRFDPENESIHELTQQAAIELHFGDYGEGKPFSWASILSKKGYKGMILAGGQLGIDRMFYAFRCGFTLVWLSDDEFTILSPLHLQPFTDSYQPAVGDS